MLVSDLVNMPVSEYYRWYAFVREKSRRERGEIDPKQASPEELAKAFGAD